MRRNESAKVRRFGLGGGEMYTRIEGNPDNECSEK